MSSSDGSVSTWALNAGSRAGSPQHRGEAVEIGAVVGRLAQGAVAEHGAGERAACIPPQERIGVMGEEEGVFAGGPGPVDDHGRGEIAG